MLPLREPAVSGLHARIVADANVCYVEDLGSTNGTRVNGLALGPKERRALQGGEKIEIGTFELQVMPEQCPMREEEIADDPILPLSRAAPGSAERTVRVLAVVALVTCVLALAVVVAKRLL